MGSVSYIPSASPSYEASNHVNNYAYSGKLLLLLLLNIHIRHSIKGSGLSARFDPSYGGGDMVCCVVTCENNKYSFIHFRCCRGINSFRTTTLKLMTADWH